MINGSEYSFEDVKIVMGNRAILTIQDFEYTVKKDLQVFHGQGNEPYHIGTGKKEYSGKITVLQSDLEAMQRQLPKGKDITDVNGIDVVCCYAPEGGELTTDIVTRIRISEVKKGMKNGDGAMICELPYLSPKILYNV